MHAHKHAFVQAPMYLTFTHILTLISIQKYTHTLTDIDTQMHTYKHKLTLSHTYIHKERERDTN